MGCSFCGHHDIRLVVLDEVAAVNGRTNLPSRASPTILPALIARTVTMAETLSSETRSNSRPTFRAGASWPEPSR